MRKPLIAAVVLSVSCGGKNLSQEPPRLDSSPWLLTLERTEATRPGGPLRAHRLRDGQVVSELLEPSATLVPSWSPSRRWMAYPTTASADGSAFRLRHFDGERWGEPITFVTPGGEGATSASRSMAWSRTRDWFLTRTATGFVVAIPHEDGSIATKPLSVENALSVWWSTEGDRIIVMHGGSSPTERRASVFEVSDGPEPITRSLEIAPPEGMTFDDVDSGHDETGIPNGSISGDERWIVFVVKRGPDDTEKAFYAFSTTDEAPPHVLEGCVASWRSGTPNTGGDLCRPESWQPGSGTLLFMRSRPGMGTTLDAWTPSTDTVATLGNRRSHGWIGPARSLLLTQEEGSKALSAIELRDGSAPLVTPLPTTERASFQRATPSYDDGRWVILSHVDRPSNESWLEAVDLASPTASWNAREIHRGSIEVERKGFFWSPGGAFILIAEPQPRIPSAVARGTRIDIATGAASTIEIDLSSPDGGTVPPSWQWQHRIAYDDRTIAIPHDGSLALWRMDAPKETATKLEGVSADATVRWVPVP